MVAAVVMTDWGTPEVLVPSRIVRSRNRSSRDPAQEALCLSCSAGFQLTGAARATLDHGIPRSIHAARQEAGVWP